jgi:Spy/CpxP family protein refolding chaperone
MKSLCLVLSGCMLFAGAAQAQLVPASARDRHAGVRRGLAEAAGGEDGQGAPDAAAAQDVPELTDAQRTAIASLRGETERKATLMAVQLAAVVQRIYDNNLSDRPNEELRVALDNEMKDLVWQMLMTKGDAMWAAFRLLTPEQKRIVRTEIAKPRAPGDLPDVMDLIVKTFKLTGP